MVLGEQPAQRARRQQAVGAARLVNTIQANQPGRSEQRYLRHEDLATAPLVSRRPESVAPFNLAPGQEVARLGTDPQCHRQGLLVHGQRQDGSSVDTQNRPLMDT